MRIKNRYSINDKVEIVVDSDYKFQEIACLVDSHNFIIESRILKQKLSISEPIVDLKTEFVDLFSHWEKIYSKWSLKNKSKAKTLENWANRTLRRQNCSAHLKDTAIQAILFNMAVSYSGDIRVLNEKSRFTSPTIAIFPTPHTTYDEIKEALRKSKKLMKLIPSKYKSKGLKDTTPNIRMYREWFWQVALGNSYKDVAQEWNNKHNTKLIYSDIGKALNTYRDMLL